MSIFPYWTENLNWGEQCGATLVNVYDVLSGIELMSHTSDASEYLSQVLAWKQMFISEANSDMARLAQGFVAAAVELSQAASLV
jgi:hypothetical protein